MNSTIIEERGNGGVERRQANVRELVLTAAETLFAQRGFHAVSVREIASAAGAHPGSVTYHFSNKLNLLREIYRRHCGPMNARRLELLCEARRIRASDERLAAILRAYLIPAFSKADQPGGGMEFTLLRAALSTERDPEIRKIIAEEFDEMTQVFIDALHEELPHLTRTELVWRSQFLVGSVHYTLINPDRVTRLSRGEADGRNVDFAVDALVRAVMWGLLGKETVDTGAEPKVRRRTRSKKP